MISNKYLESEMLDEISNQLYTRSPVGYYVLDDFIDSGVYEKIEKEFLEQNGEYFLTDKRDTSFMINKTVLLGTPNFLNLYNFFLGKEFEYFMKKIYRKDVKKSKQITSAWVEEHLGIPGQGVAQIYEYGDFMEWHTDLAKDLKRKECLVKGGYAEWGKIHTEKHDEVGAFIYYVFNSTNDWDNEKGGVLEVGKLEGNEIQAYAEMLPIRNRLILIKSSDTSYHRVTKLRSPMDYRISIQDLIIKSSAEIGEELLEQ